MELVGVHGAKDFNLEPLLTELAMLPWGESSKTVVLRDAHLVSAETMEKLARWLEDNPRPTAWPCSLSKLMSG